MPIAKEFELAEYQAGLFTPGLQFVPAKILAEINARWGDKFDADPVLIPQVPQAPAGVPRLVLRSQDGRFRFQAGAVRVDLFRQRIAADDVISIAETLDLALEIFQEYLKTTYGIVNRLAAVIRRTAAQDEPGKYLARHFCRDKWLAGPLNRPAQFELHAHKVFTLPNMFPVNSWIRCKSGELAAPPGGPIVLVEQDFNTLAEDAPTREFSFEEVSSFFRAVPQEFDKVLCLYFPEGDDV